MKLKKLLSLTLIFAVLCTLFGGFAALAKDEYVKADIVSNGNMDMLGTTFGAWEGAGGTENLSTSIYRSSDRSMKLASKDARRIVLQTIPGAIPGKNYTVTGWLYIKELLDLSANVGGGIKIEFMKETADGTGYDYCAGSAGEFFAGPLEKWMECSVSAIAPDDATAIRIMLRLDCGGEIYWDDVTCVGEVAPETKERVENEAKLAKDIWDHSNELLTKSLDASANIAIAPGVQNVVKNPSFEEIGMTYYKMDGPLDWIPKKDSWNGLVSYTDQEAHTGKYSAKISTDDRAEGLLNPWIQHIIDDNLVANTDYILSAWVKVEEIEDLRGPLMKIEAYNAGSASTLTAVGSAQSYVFNFRDDEWHQIKLLYTLPEGTTNARLYIRMNGPGTIYIDDVEFGPTGTASAMDFYTIKTFYYTEDENIEAYADINYINHPIEDGNYVEFAVKDGETVIASEAVPASSKVVWTFPTMTLAEMHKTYTISATYKKADGTVIQESAPKRIYRYDRPTMLNEDGAFVDENGEVVDIFYLYGASTEFLQDFKDAGFTVIRPLDPRFKLNDVKGIREVLDEMHAVGLKCLFPLYGNPAGHPLQIPTTNRLVTEFKDHPAVMGWMMMDEPSMHARPGQLVQTYEEMLEYLEEGYKVIRNIDPYHPVYNIETTGVPNSYERCFQYVDIAAIDIYPNYGDETYRTYQYMTKAVDAVADEIEVWNLGYAASWDTTYIPDDDAMRIQCYTAFWGGASGVGFYTSPEYAPTMNETFKKSNASGELKLLFDHFVREETPKFNEYMGSDYWYRSWIKDGKLYLAIKEHKNDGVNTEAEFKLVSDNGKIEINGFDAKLVNGTTESRVTSNDSTFRLTLEPTKVSMYEITPKAPVDFSAVTDPIFTDMAGFEWAKTAVETTIIKGIANKKGATEYAPGQNITRGDFAMYLIRALNLKADTTDQFTDVDPNAEYAKEVAIGKALGILKGSGDGTYNPEEAISRQDLMVICARGLRHIGRIATANVDAALGNFTDKGIIADYATQDIAAMVSAKIVSGNPDLTINPLGNTTRAEAAVIMDRIAH
ncbi:MAG: S-layer homology domain-containing protein [Clostridia bacterium]|nr:S-layer homology domain-containing protein [Clostridia bacterium]